MDFTRRVKIVHRTISLLTLLATIFLFISFISSFDMINGYFIDGIFPTLFKLSFVLGIVFSLTCIFSLKKQEIIKSNNELNNLKYTYIALAIALVIGASIYYSLATSMYANLILIGVDCFALFILFCAISKDSEYYHLKLICLLLSTLFPLPIVIDNNSVMYRHSNSVENTLMSVFAIAFLIYILYEGKRIFTEEHSRWHLASMLLLTHIGFSMSISYITVYLMGVATEKTRFLQMILVFIVSLFVEIELIRFTKVAESHTKEEWDEIEAPEEIAIEEIQTEENIDIEKTDD